MTHAYLFIYLMHIQLQTLHQLPTKGCIKNIIQSCWDIEDNDEMKQKIWKIAQQRYKGWGATFSATYKAFNTYDERMKNRPEDLDIMECRYLIKYFGSKKLRYNTTLQT